MTREEKTQILKDEYYKLAEKFTPEEIKDSPLFDLKSDGEINFYLTSELIEKLKIEAWLLNYEKEAKVSTGGIRGPQNVLYPWDTRFPINQMGVALATIGKGLVLKEDKKEEEIHKITAGEVRYNTELYVDLISRVQAHMGIHSHLPFNRQTVPVWMVSFLIFMQDYDGGEFVTSSHAISSKIATKDLENQGSQFMPEMSMRFIEKIKGVIKYAKEHKEGYKITLAPRNSSFIKEDFNGYDLYTDYLKKTVAKNASLDVINKAREAGFKIMFETVGGCMGRTMPEIMERLEIQGAFEWRDKTEDPFFHGVGKAWKLNPKTGKEEFFDYSCDFCLLDVTKTAGFQFDLVDKPIGYTILITDPDGDRLSIGQIESTDKKEMFDHLGIDYIPLGPDKILVVYHPTFGFFLIMDFYMKQLKAEGIFENHPRCMVVTTPCSKSWNEWAEKNNIKIVTTPVGIKEIVTIAKKVEKQILENKEKDVVVEDIYGDEINLGKDPRMLFGGEESGGMIIGLEDFTESRGGRKAFAMREKSAGEASVVATALAAYLYLEKKTLAEYLEETFKENSVVSTIYLRDDIVYYNESEPDPVKLLQAKKEGEVKRDKIDTFYLSMVLAFREKKIPIEQIKNILREAIPDLDFSGLLNIRFTGEATFFQFDNNMFIQIRRSGTDAKMRGYAGGPDKERCKTYMDKLLHYSGERPDLYQSTVPMEFQENVHARAQKIYLTYLYKGL